MPSTRGWPAASPPVVDRLGGLRVRAGLPVVVIGELLVDIVRVPDGSTVERRISPNTTIRADANGAAIFGRDNTDGKGDSVFGLLKTIADTLRSGGDVAAHIGDMDMALNTVINGRSEVGARHAQLLRAQDANANAVVDLENQRSGIEDLDLSKAFLDVKTQELSYQAALSVTAKALQPTLMDFLR